MPGKTGVVSLALKPSKTSFTFRNTIMRKGIAYVRTFDLTLPLHPIEVELENNKCCLETHNSSDTTVYFDIRSKGLVQVNNSKHLLIDQYLHDRVTPATLSPRPLVYGKPIDPSKMP